MKRSEAFPSKYISKDDVTTPRLGTIDHLKRETLKSDDGDETKTVMYFREEVLKPMILNNTNWLTLEDAYGEDSDMWLGKKVEIYFDPNVMFGAKRTGGVRVRVPAQASTNGNGYLSKEQAIAAVEAVGLDKNALIDALKQNGSVDEQGRAFYKPERDTALVRQLVAANQPEAEPF